MSLKVNTEKIKGRFVRGILPYIHKDNQTTIVCCMTVFCAPENLCLVCEEEYKPMLLQQPWM